MNIADQHISMNSPINGRVDRMTATETVDSGSISDQTKTMKIDINSFPAWRPALKGQYESSTACDRQEGRWQLDSKTCRSLRCLLTKAN